MSPTRWGKLLLMLGVAVEVTSLPQQFFPSLTRNTRQLGSINDQTLLCLLFANEEGRNSNSCNTSPDENSSLIQTGTAVPSAEIPGSILSTEVPPVFTPTQQAPNDPLPKFSDGLTQADPNAVPPPSCRCVPHWQCKDDKKSSQVEGDNLTSFALDLRSSGCPAPEEVCCIEVDVSIPPPTVPLVTPLCGERNLLGVGNTFLGFEDQQSQFGEFPWTAAIISSRNFSPSERALYISGGSLIHPQVVITAAHNMLNYTAALLKVRLGEWNLASQTEVTPHQTVPVRQVLYHPNYHKVHQYYDVALLLLERPAVLDATVNTICLPSPHQDYRSDECVVSGWGTKHFGSKRKYQMVMKKVSLPLVAHPQCQAALQGTRLGPRFKLHDSFLCAGGQKEGQDACTGDGGSPLACPLQSDPHRYVQVGVVAWGIGCGTLGLPGVYADVVKALPWIEQVIGQTFGVASGTGKLPFDVRISRN